eukprot:SAG25_NODE_462_length_7803_cov_21.430945_8_plen_71_part_00
MVIDKVAEGSAAAAKPEIQRGMMLLSVRKDHTRSFCNVVCAVFFKQFWLHVGGSKWRVLCTRQHATADQE